MALARAVLAGLLVFVASVWVGHSGARPPIRVVVEAAPVVTIPSTTTTTTSTVPPPPTTAKPRASRGEAHRSPPVVPPVAPVGCDSWAAKTRAESDACWTGPVSAYDWPTSWALAAIWCESRGNPWAKNRYSSAAGLFQILHADVGDGPGNIALAHSMWVNRGTSPWAASRSCWS